MRANGTDQTAVIALVPAPAGSTDGARPAIPAGIPPAAPEPLTNPRLTVLAWLIPFLTCAAAGCWNVTTPALSDDELTTWGMVTAGWGDFVRVLTGIDASVGPYYALLHVWASLAGDSDLLLRLPSVLFAAGAAGLVSAIGIRLAGRRVGLTSGLIFAVLPSVSRYAQDARPYALTMLAAAWSTYLLIAVADRPRLRLYACYALSVAVLGLSHVVALLLLPAHGLFLVREIRSRRVSLGWLGAVLIGLAPAAPMLYYAQMQSRRQIGWIPPLSWARLTGMPEQVFGAAVIAGAVGALALSALSLRAPVRVLTLWAVVPPAALAAAALLIPLWLSRYLLFVLPAWALLAGLAIRRLTLLRALVVVLGIGAVSIPAQAAIRTPTGHNYASRDVSLIIKAHRMPGDAVLFGPNAGGDQQVSRNAFMRYLPADQRPADKLMSRPPRTTGGLGAQECSDADIPSCFGRPDRVWVIRRGVFTDLTQDIGAAKEQLLRQDFVPSRRWPLKNFTVALYVRRPAA